MKVKIVDVGERDQYYPIKNCLIGLTGEFEILTDDMQGGYFSPDNKELLAAVHTMREGEMLFAFLKYDKVEPIETHIFLPTGLSEIDDAKPQRVVITDVAMHDAHHHKSNLVGTIGIIKYKRDDDGWYSGSFISDKPVDFNGQKSSHFIFWGVKFVKIK